MERHFKYILTALIIALIVSSCRQNIVDGIFIDHTLYETQNYAENKKLRRAIHRALRKDTKALVELIQFQCGGAAGCYDLGFIITQIIYKIGEKEFMLMAEKLSNNEMKELEGFIEAGLEYGYNFKDFKSNDERFKDEFSELYNLLRKQNRPFGQNCCKNKYQETKMKVIIPRVQKRFVPYISW